MNALDLGYGIAAAVSSPLWMRKKRSGWAERFMRVVPRLPDRQAGIGRVLLHAVSVGEVNALRELVPALREHVEVVVSVSTDTGIARARELFDEPAKTGVDSHACFVVRYPLDGSWMVRRFLDAVDVDAVGLIELEIWPNFVAACQKRGIPVAVLNGRLSERSFKGYTRIKRWIRPSFEALAVAGVQDEQYAQRFVDMGVPAERCVLTGSMKFDSTRIVDSVDGASELAGEMGVDLARPVIVAGSTGPGEEAFLCGLWQQRWRDRGVQLVCAPRKPERFDDAAKAMPGCCRRSRSAHGAHRSEGLFLLDTIGELAKAYSLADIAIVGRSFFDLHGSDPIEPIALGVATLIGPAVSDFSTIVDVLVRDGGLLQVHRDCVGDEVDSLLDDPARREAMVNAGRAVIRQMQGASSRHAELMLWLASEHRKIPAKGQKSESVGA